MFITVQYAPLKAFMEAWHKSSKSGKARELVLQTQPRIPSVVLIGVEAPLNMATALAREYRLTAMLPIRAKDPGDTPGAFIFDGVKAWDALLTATPDDGGQVTLEIGPLKDGAHTIVLGTGAFAAEKTEPLPIDTLPGKNEKFQVEFDVTRKLVAFMAKDGIRVLFETRLDFELRELLAIRRKFEPDFMMEQELTRETYINMSQDTPAANRHARRAAAKETEGKAPETKPAETAPTAAAAEGAAPEAAAAEETTTEETADDAAEEAAEQAAEQAAIAAAEEAAAEAAEEAAKAKDDAEKTKVKVAPAVVAPPEGNGAANEADARKRRTKDEVLKGKIKEAGEFLISNGYVVTLRGADNNTSEGLLLEALNSIARLDVVLKDLLIRSKSEKTPALTEEERLQLKNLMNKIAH